MFEITLFLSGKQLLARDVSAVSSLGLNLKASLESWLWICIPCYMVVHQFDI